MKVFKGILLALALLAAACAAVLIYAGRIEPYRVKIERLEISGAAVSAPMRVAAFGDTHVGNGLTAEDIRRAAEKIEALQPDILVFLGDLFDDYQSYGGDEEEELARVLAFESLPNMQKYAVYGNHDLGGGAKRMYEQIMADAGFELLVNGRADAGKNVNIIGADDWIFGTPDISGCVREGMFNLLLAHEPDWGANAQGVQLQLSGHSHGGQISLPLLTRKILPFGAHTYVRGSYEKEDGGIVYVNRGLGMSKLRLRFASAPEITLVEITP